MGVDENVRVFFQRIQGFAEPGPRSVGTPPKPSLCHTICIQVCCVFQMSKNLLLGVTDITGFTLSSEFLHLEVKTPLSGEPDGIVCRFGVDFGFSCSYGLT